MNPLNAIHLANNARMGTRNGVAIPLSYQEGSREHLAVRKNILLSDYSHFGIASITGESAFELLNAVVAGNVSSIRDEQAMYTLVLDTQGHIQTDLYLLCDEERFLLLSEWMNGEALCALLQQELEGKEDLYPEIEAIEALSPEWGILHLEGPYCWELLAEIFGMDIIGLPFQEHMHLDELLLLRSGKHGEFSYKLCGPQDELAALWPQLIELGEKYQLQCGGLDYQRQVRLENPCWEPELFDRFSRCPIELQMQWAVRYDKESFYGLDALSDRLAAGITRRAVGIVIDGEPAQMPQTGDQVYFGDLVIGEVIICGYSADLGFTVGRVMLDNAYAWTDIDAYHISLSGHKVAMKTAAVPFARNYSFLVNPSEHSFIDDSKPSNLLQQLEWQKEKEEREKQQAAEQSAS